MRRLVLASALLLPLTVFAQPVAPSPGAAWSSSDMPAVGESPRLRVSPAGAVLISVGATGGLIGAALLSAEPEGTDARTALLVAAGMLVGPSVGNVVVGNYRGALIGTGVRLVGGAVGVSGAAAGFMNDGDLTLSTVLMVTGAVIYLGGTVYDVVSAGTHARGLRLTPAVDLQAGAVRATLRVGL